MFSGLWIRSFLEEKSSFCCIPLRSTSYHLPPESSCCQFDFHREICALFVELVYQLIFNADLKRPWLICCDASVYINRFTSLPWVGPCLFLWTAHCDIWFKLWSCGMNCSSRKYILVVGSDLSHTIDGNFNNSKDKLQNCTHYFFGPHNFQEV